MPVAAVREPAPVMELAPSEMASFEMMTPSITNSGCPFPRIDVIPRICTCAPPPGAPLFIEIVAPSALDDRRPGHGHLPDGPYDAAGHLATLGRGAHRCQAERKDGRKHCELAHALSPFVRMDAAGGYRRDTQTPEGPAPLQSRETLLPGHSDAYGPGRRHVTAIPMSLP